MGHVEVLFPSERFTDNPFSSYPRYMTTHASPCDGFHILVLRRDALCKLPWGFEWKRHAFGGACLVSQVDALSPAQAAVSEPERSNSPTGFLLCLILHTSFNSFSKTFLGDRESNSASMLRVNDMLLAINGIPLGGLTSQGLGIELEVCGHVVHLVVSRYKQSSLPEAHARHLEERLHSEVDEALNDKYNLDWVDAFGGETISLPETALPSDETTVDELDKKSGMVVAGAKILGARRGTPTKGNFKMSNPPSERQFTCDPVRPVDTTPTELLKGARQDTDRMIKEACNCDEDADDMTNESQYVSNGCICGTTHKKLPVFWIQCDDCAAWYCNAEKCAGMTKAEADVLDSWLCLACDECVPTSIANGGPRQTVNTSKDVVHEAIDDHDDKAAPTSGHVRSEPLDGDTEMRSEFHFDEGLNDSLVREAEHVTGAMSPSSRSEVFAKDLVVYVEEHAWTGVDNPAGIAKILDSRIDDDGYRVYDIRYVVGGTRKNVEAKYISRHSWEYPAGW